MAVYRRSRRHRFVLVLLVLTSVTVITLDFRGSDNGVIQSIRSSAHDAFAPVQSATARVLSPIGDFFGSIARYGSIRAENRRLRQELDRTRADAVRAADAQRERQLLLSLQGLDFAGDLLQVSARVVSVAPSNFQLTITIDRGAAARVEVGMPVVTNAGLAGRVIEVSKERAVVLLLTDPSSSVGVRLTRSGDFGVASGAGARAALPLDLVGVETKVSEGEEVVTSGLEQGIFPPEIPVGRVTSVKMTPGALQQEVKIEPIADLLRMEFVKVLLWKPVVPPGAP